jgi:hypothetical protein
MYIAMLVPGLTSLRSSHQNIDFRPDFAGKWYWLMSKRTNYNDALLIMGVENRHKAYLIAREKSSRDESDGSMKDRLIQILTKELLTVIIRAGRKISR